MASPTATPEEPKALLTFSNTLAFVHEQIWSVSISLDIG